MSTIESTENVMRQEYKVLSDGEKLAMERLKDMGNSLYDFINSLGQGREYSLAKTKVEEAIMWSVKGLTK